MRNNYAEISKSVWDNALDYPGKEKPAVEPEVKHNYSDDELDAMVERANKRLKEREFGRKLLEFANTPMADRKLLEERIRDVATEVNAHAYVLQAEDMPAEIEKIAREEKVVPEEIWRSANEFLIEKKYEADKDKLKFYYPLTADEVTDFLRTGKITNTDDSGNPLKSSLEFTADYKDMNGQWKSGYGLAGREVERAVTLVLDGSLLEAEGFTAIGDNPHAQEINLRKCCIGIVNEGDDNDARKLRQLLRREEIPFGLYGHYDKSGRFTWGDAYFDAENLRIQRDRRKAELEQSRAMRAEIYDNVDQQGIQEATKISLERDKKANAEALMQLKWNLTTEQEQREAEQAILKYYCELLDIVDEPWVQHYQNASDPAGAYYQHRRGNQAPVVRVNKAKTDVTNLGALVAVFAHELWHARQNNLWDRLEARQLDGEVKHRAELYRYNFNNYIPMNVDMESYRKQLVEKESRYFEAQSYKLFKQKYTEARRPVNRLKNRARKVLGRK